MKDLIDVSADVDALVKDEDLSEEFKNKATTIFEAAVKAKITEHKEKLNAEFDKKLNEEIEVEKEKLSEKVDTYLTYVVEEWMKENSIAIERGIKGEIAEDFISGLKKLFEDHYIDVPDEKYDVLEDQSAKIEELNKRLTKKFKRILSSKNKIVTIREMTLLMKFHLTLLIRKKKNSINFLKKLNIQMKKNLSQS